MIKKIKVIILLLLFILSCSMVSLAQDIDSVDAILNMARKQLFNIEFGKCIESAGNVLELLPDDLYHYDGSPQVRSRVLKAYEYRALAHYNLGDKSRSEADFSKILELYPSYKLGDEFATVKINSFFNGIRNKTIGYLTLSSMPSEAVVFLSDKILGQTNFVKIPMKFGRYKLKLQLPGYKDNEIEVTIAPGKEARGNVQLVRTEASLTLRTSPSDAEVYLNGKLIGTTTGKALDSVREKANIAGVALNEVSADFRIPRLAMGEHTIEFRKPCYESQSVKLPEITSAIDYNLPEIFVLNREVGRLELNAASPDAQVYLNGKLQTRNQSSFADLCVGTYRLDVVSRSGRFTRNVLISKNKTTYITVTAKPAMIMMSAALDSRIQNQRLNSIKGVLAELKNQLTAFTVLTPGENALGNKARLLRLIRNLEVNGNRGKVPNILFLAIKTALVKQKARLLMVVEPQVENGRANLRVVLFNDLIPWFEVVAIENSDANSFKDILAKLNYDLVTEEAWLGVKAVDTRLFEQPVIVQIQKGSPAARTGLEDKSRITSIDGVAVTSVKQLLDMKKSWEPGNSIKIGLSLGQDKVTPLLLEYSPLLIEENNPDILYNVAIAVLGSRQEGANANIARFNTAITLMHFGAWSEAVTILRRLRLGNGPGINQGTVFFYIGKCYEGLGYDSQAMENYMKAGSYRNATLRSHDGPLLKYEVVSKIKKLGSR